MNYVSEFLRYSIANYDFFERIGAANGGTPFTLRKVMFCHRYSATAGVVSDAFVGRFTLVVGDLRLHGAVTSVRASPPVGDTKAKEVNFNDTCKVLIAPAKFCNR